MPLDDRRGRHAALFKGLETNDLESWYHRFLTALTQPLNLPNRLGQADFSPDLIWQVGVSTLHQDAA
jgi:hypothetical protein